MGLNNAHEGYEYQDFFALLCAFNEIIKHNDCNFTIDKKVTPHDKFDDFKIELKNCVECYQVKYSNEEVNHTLEFYDLSNGNGHDTALSDLYFSWKELKKVYAKRVFVRLCLAWNRPQVAEDILDYLIPVEIESVYDVNICCYKVNVDALWEKGELPKAKWRKFRMEMNSEKREDFKEFCNDFFVELELPKASLEISKPKKLENQLIELISKIGIGKYPNDELNPIDCINRGVMFIKYARTKSASFSIAELIGKMGIVTDYNCFSQHFAIDDNLYIENKSQFDQIVSLLSNGKKIIFTGEPGAGKSWFIEKLHSKLENIKLEVFRFNCYVDIKDKYYLDRIQTESMYSNLVSQIISAFPDINQYKTTTFGSDKNELENMLSHINKNCIIIIDGLDHVERVYESNKELIEKRKTEILDSILNLNIPSMVGVILSSQPLHIFEKFVSLGYINIKINTWDKEDIEQYLDRNNIENAFFDVGSMLSDILMSKSQGNALYVNYLVRHLQQTKTIQTDVIDCLPNYDEGMRSYYKYLYNQLSDKNIIWTLSGMDFYISLSDLKNITGLGMKVDEVVHIVCPVLRFSEVSGNFLIYHESFRRFIRDELKEKNIDIKKVIYRDTIEWLEQMGLFNSPKAYFNLFRLLLIAEEDKKIISLVDKNFVYESYLNGYSYKSIKQNYKCFLQAVCKEHDFVSLALASELGNTIDMTEYDNQESEEYLEAVSAAYGIERVKNMMIYEGEAALNTRQGLNACYLCSKKNVIPDWKLYIDDKEEITIDEFHFYFRAHIDMYGIEMIDKWLSGLDKKKDTEFIRIIEEELNNYVGEDECGKILKKYNLFDSTEPKNITTNEILILLNRILEYKHISEENADELNDFFRKINQLDADKKENIIKEIENRCSNINWFYNWIIYKVNLINFKGKKYLYEGDKQKNLLSYMEILIRDTEVFKGEPRTCDLYRAKKLISDSILECLKYIQGKENWTKAITIITQLSIETTSYLDNSPTGALPSYELIYVLKQCSLENDAREGVLEALSKILKNIEEEEVYGNISSAYYNAACIYSHYQMEGRAKEALESGVRYAMAYGYHKDVTFEQIIYAYPIMYSVDKEFIEEYRDSITKMAIEVSDHTDGRITNHYLNRWYEQLLATDIKYATAFLRDLQLELPKGWIFNNMMLSALCEISKNEKYDYFSKAIIESMPNNVSYKLVDVSLGLIERIKKNDKKFAKQLCVNISSRYSGGMQKNDDRLTEEHLLKLKEFQKEFQIDFQYYNIENSDSKTEQEDFYANKKNEFDVKTYEEAQQWFSQYYVVKNNVEDIKCFLENEQYNDNTLINLFDLSIKLDKYGGNIVGHFDNLMNIIECITCSNRCKAIILCKIFCQSRSSFNYIMDKNEAFVRAYELDANTTIDVLFEELYYHMQNLGVTITTNLLRALQSIDGNKELMHGIWENTYEVIKRRLPIDENKEIFPIGEQLEIEENLSCIILGRMLHGEKERFLSAYAFQREIIEQQKYAWSKASFVWAFEHFSKFNYISKLAILKEVEMADDIFGNDYTEELYGVLCNNQEFIPDRLLSFVISQSFMRAFEGNKDLQNSREYFEEVDAKRIEAMIYNHKQLRLFHDYSIIDVTPIVQEIVSNGYRKEIWEFTNRTNKGYVEETFTSSIVLNIIGKLDVWREEPMLFMMLGLEILPDFEWQYFINRIRTAPINYRFAKKSDGSWSKKIDLNTYSHEYIRVAYFLKEIHLDYGKYSVKTIEQGVTFEKEEKAPYEFALGCGVGKPVNVGRIMHLCSENNTFDTFESEQIFWLSYGLLLEYPLQMAIDLEENELQGIDANGTVQLKFRHWRCAYHGNDDYENREIPTLIGRELLMKKSFLQEIQKQYGKMYIRTVVETKD